VERTSTAAGASAKFGATLAGGAFVVGKTSSCVAMALTFAHYVAPADAHLLAVAAVAALTAVNLAGIERTAGLTRVTVMVVLAALAVFVVAALTGGTVDAGHFSDTHGGVLGVLRSGGILFFAFAGYARIATLGEEVVEPARTIPRAISIALAITVAVYAAVAVATLAAAPPAVIASTQAPLREVLRLSSNSELVPVVQVGAAVASLGVLLSLLAGVSRTVFAMAADRHLPHTLAAVHASRRIPHRAEILVGAAAALLAALVDIRGAIGFSSVCVLFYHAVANASALTLRRRLAVPALGLVGCAVLAVTLPVSSVVAGAAAIGAAALIYLLRHQSSGLNRRSDSVDGTK
jgi:APA family basic amino acid/polyamine antiporter